MSFDDQMAEAMRRQRDASLRSESIDRTGWTRRQWVEDAERLMNEPDGAITSLVNGHVMYMLTEIRVLRAALAVVDVIDTSDPVMGFQEYYDRVTDAVRAALDQE